jgi:hypothetical protein
MIQARMRYDSQSRSDLTLLIRRQWKSDGILEQINFLTAVIIICAVVVILGVGVQ